jgi:hypothetical protein
MANYFKHAVAEDTLHRLQAFVWWRIIAWVMYRHRLSWTALRRRFKGPDGWRPCGCRKFIQVSGLALRLPNLIMLPIR